MRTSVLLLSATSPEAEGPGGVSIHVAALAAHVSSGILLHAAFPSGDELVVRAPGSRQPMAILPLGERGGLEEALVAAIAGTQAGVLHLHSPELGPAAVAAAVRRTGVRLAVTLHDHSLVCENLELLEGGSRYCGIPADPSRCDRCLATTRGRPPGAVRQWRNDMLALVHVTDAFVAPSESVLEHAARLHPEVRERARRIDWGIPPPLARSTRSAVEAGPLRVAVVGTWATVKGVDQLPHLIAGCDGLDVEWHLFGATDGASRVRVERSARRLVVHGAYRRATLAPRLVASGCHVALLPSVGAESFSLVLSEVTAAGLPVVASTLGALGERVHGEELGWTFDPWKPDELATLLATLHRERRRIDEAAARVRAKPVRSEDAMSAEHAAMWRALHPSVLAPPLEAARTAFVEGAAKARSRKPWALGRLVARVRATDFYRDLPLRRALPESTRRAVEAAVRRIVARAGRR